MLNNKQIEVLAYDNKYEPYILVNEGSVRTGKTIIDNHIWLKHIHKFKGQNKMFVMSSTTQGTLEKNVLNELEDMFGIDCRLNKNNEFELFGNKMLCFGADKADSYKRMKGFTAYGAYINEATEHHKSSIDQIVKRCSGDGARIIMDTNPAEPSHYIKKNFIDKSDTLMESGRVFIKSFHWVLDDNSKANNGFLSAEYIEGLKKATPSGHYYDRDILGLWVAAEGMIYKDYNEYNHVISLKEFNEKYKHRVVEYWGSIDWGWEHNGVIIIKARLDNNVIVNVDSIHGNHINISGDNRGKTWRDYLIDFNAKYGHLIYYYDRSRPEHAQELSRVAKLMPASNSVIEGLSFTAGLYKANKKLIVRETNPLFFDEIYSYVWNTKSLKEEPVKEKDDYMDCDRYGDYSHVGINRKLSFA